MNLRTNIKAGWPPGAYKLSCRILNDSSDYKYSHRVEANCRNPSGKYQKTTIQDVDDTTPLSNCMGILVKGTSCPVVN